MLVMVSNHVSWRTHYLQGRYGGLALLLPPCRLMGPYPHLPYAVDNGAFPAWKNGEPWDEDTFVKSLDWVAEQQLLPRWIVVPDVVTDPEGTFEAWEEWAPRLRRLGVPLALAVQDGMTPAEVYARADPEVIFVGGSRDWKLATRREWAKRFPRVHVGRVNGVRDLLACRQLGVESVDGTGFFRGRRKQLEGLIDYLEAFQVEDDLAPMFAPKDDGHPVLPFDGENR